MAKTKEQSQADGAAEETAGAGKSVTKTAAVRQALARMGRSAMPARIKDFVEKEFGLEMSLNHISNIKSSLGKRKGGKKHKHTTPPAESAPRSTANGMASRGHATVSFEDIEATKLLARRIGAKQLHALIDLVTK